MTQSTQATHPLVQCMLSACEEYRKLGNPTSSVISMPGSATAVLVPDPSIPDLHLITSFHRVKTSSEDFPKHPTIDNALHFSLGVPIFDEVVTSIQFKGKGTTDYSGNLARNYLQTSIIKAGEKANLKVVDNKLVVIERLNKLTKIFGDLFMPVDAVMNKINQETEGRVGTAEIRILMMRMLDNTISVVVSFCVQQGNRVLRYALDSDGINGIFACDGMQDEDHDAIHATHEYSNELVERFVDMDPIVGDMVRLKAAVIVKLRDIISPNIGAIADAFRTTDSPSTHFKIEDRKEFISNFRRSLGHWEELNEDESLWLAENALSYANAIFAASFYFLRGRSEVTRRQTARDIKTAIGARIDSE